MKKYWKEIVLTICSMIFILLIMEIGFRQFGPISSPLQPPFVNCNLKGTVVDGVPTYFPNQQCYHCYQRGNRKAYFDNAVVHDGQKYDCILYQTNSEGFRSPQFQRKKLSGEKRIITVGDSFTFGDGVKQKDTYPRLIQDNIGLETINLAMQALNTHQERLILEKNMDLEPDLVILGLVLNDIFPYEKTIKSGKEYIKSTQAPDWIKFSKLSSFLFQRISPAIHLSKEVENYHWWFDHGWQTISDELILIKDLCSKNRSKFVIVLFPLFEKFGKDYPFDKIHSKIKNFAKDNKIEILDLYPQYAEKSEESFWVHPMDHHPNSLAHKIATENILRWIRNQTF